MESRHCAPNSRPPSRSGMPARSRARHGRRANRTRWPGAANAQFRASPIAPDAFSHRALSGEFTFTLVRTGPWTIQARCAQITRPIQRLPFKSQPGQPPLGHRICAPETPKSSHADKSTGKKAKIRWRELPGFPIFSCQDRNAGFIVSIRGARRTWRTI